MLTFSKYLKESKFKGNVYHGSGSDFAKFEQSKARIPNDFYGGGTAYFTDNFDVAVTYAKSMAKKSKGDPLVYSAQINIRKLFDVDDIFTGQDLIDILPKDTEDFARGAGLLGMDVENKFTVIVRLEKGKLELTGDQVFKGLSKGMNSTANARKHLISKGYTGLRYNGGVNMNMATKHNVYLVYNVKDIKMVDKEKV